MSCKKSSQTVRRGFTMIETVVVLAVIIIIASMAIPRILDSYAFGARDAIDDARNIVHLLGTAQTYAVSGKTNSNRVVDWGVHVVDNGTTDCGTTEAQDCIVVYAGADFSGRDSSHDQVYVLSGSNRWADESASVDFYFNRYSGFAKKLHGVPPDPVAYYSFENATTSDFSGYGQNATTTGGLATFSSCARNSDCFNLNGSSDEINVSSTARLETSVFSAAAWVNLDNEVSLPTIVAKPDEQNGTGWSFNYDTLVNGWGMCFWVTTYDDLGSPGGACSTAFTLDEWHHVVGTYDGTNQRLYIDGSLADTAPQNTYTPTTEPLNIGHWVHFYYWDGYIDDVLLYDRVLTAREIKELHDYTRPTTSDSLIAPTALYITNGNATSSIYVYPSGYAEVKI